MCTMFLISGTQPRRREQMKNQWKVTIEVHGGRYSAFVFGIDREAAQEAAIEAMEEQGIVHGNVISIRRVEA